MENRKFCAICGGFLIYFGTNIYCKNVECPGYVHYPHEQVSQRGGFAGFNNSATYTTTGDTGVTGTASTSTSTT